MLYEFVWFAKYPTKTIRQLDESGKEVMFSELSKEKNLQRFSLVGKKDTVTVDFQTGTLWINNTLIKSINEPKELIYFRRVKGLLSKKSIMGTMPFYSFFIGLKNANETIAIEILPIAAIRNSRFIFRTETHDHTWDIVESKDQVLIKFKNDIDIIYTR